MEQDTRTPATSASTDDESERLLELIRTLVAETRRGATPEVNLDTRLLEDLGIDSLAGVELNLRCEQAFGRSLDDEALVSVRTPRELLAALRRATDVERTSSPQQTAPAPAVFSGSPEDAATLMQALAWHVARHPQRVHVTLLADDEQLVPLTYGELHTRAQSAAAVLIEHGLAPGQTCALMLPTSLEFFVAFYGILYAGGVPVPLYPPARPAALEEHLKRQAGILANCEAALLITVPEAKPLARLLKPLAPTLHDVLTPTELEAQSASALPIERDADALALLQYTSGSTGNPKGVMLTHAQLLANLRAMGTAVGARPTDVFVSWLPLYHDMGLIGAWLGSLYYGMRLVLFSPLAFLARPARWLRAIAHHRGTISAAPNFAYEICASRIEDHDLQGLDLSRWRWAFNGAEAVSADTLARFAARFSASGFDARALTPVYGLAECGLDLAFPPPHRGVRIDRIDREALMLTGRALPAVDPAHALQIIACDSALPGYEIRIVDHDGHVLPERHQGGVQFRGPSATAGYFRNAEATAQLVDGEWRNSGDLGYLADGELFVTGRDKDLIIRAGHNLHPLELEAAAGGLKGIRRGCVAVIGVPDARDATERVVVIAETRETAAPRLRELRNSIQEHAIALLDGPADEIVLAPPGAVLKTSSGKIRRAATRDAYLQGRLGAPARGVWWQIVRLTLQGASARLRHAAARVAQIGFGLWAGAVGLVLAFAAALCALWVPDLNRRRRWARQLARTALRLAGVKATLTGVEHLPQGAHILVCNHASYIDGIVLTALLPPRYAVVAKRELRDHWLTARLLAAVGTRYVERVEAAQGIEDTRALAAALHAGESLLLFPEGTFSEAEALLPLRMGAFVLAAQADVPLVPALLTGTRTLLPVRARLLRPAAIALHIQAPLTASGFGWNDAVALRDATREVLLAGLQQGAASQQ